MTKTTPRFKFIVLLVLLVAVGLAAFFWTSRRGDRGKLHVALVGFFATDELVYDEAGKTLGVRVDSFSRSDFFSTEPETKKFDVVIVRTMGMTAEEAAILGRLTQCDVVVPYPHTFELVAPYAKIPEGVTSEQIDSYLSIPTVKNATSLLTLFKRVATGEDLTLPPPEELPESGYFYRGSDVNSTFDEWLRRPDIPELPEDAPRVALVGPFLNPYKSADSQPLEALVTAFARRGIRAVPVYGFRAAPELLDAVAPSLVVAFPLGRLLPDELAPETFRRLDVPVMIAISLSVSRKTWESQPSGMTATYQNLAVALPELDGAVAPTPVSSLEKDSDGREVRTAIDDRIERLVDRARRWIALRSKSNAEKRLAIFYRRGPGASAITAQSLDSVPSLYNTLVALRAEGYDLGADFPETEEEFAQTLDRRGRMIGQWAPGAFQTFLDEGNPERVATSDYQEWLNRDISVSARQETVKIWGAAPGRVFTGQTEEGGSFIAVSRVRFGNVVLLPQPSTAIVDDDPKASDFNSVHGTNKAPPHFYQAAYLWAREGFKADAIVHFGTHGSLEFTRGKSLMLTENDWPDALIGATPNVYLYSVNNVGEALLAKRRIYATLVSHTTPPFINAPPTDENVALDATLDAFDATQDEDVRRELIVEIEKRAQESGLTLYEPTAHDAHDHDHDEEDEHESDDERRVEFYREQLRRLTETSVSDGLHVIGRPWTEEQLAATADAVGTPDALDQLRESTSGLELQRLIAALEGRFIPPSTGGDPLVNPDSLPTGRNIAGTNIEQTPDATTFRVGVRLTDELIESFEKTNGRAPRRVAITLWGGEYVRTRGLTVAQALWAMGVRPVYDKRGSLRDLEIVPSEELGRPRIDILVQTSGQFRDAAPSRIELLDRAARMVAALDDEPQPNYVREHARSTAQTLMKNGYVPEEASELSTARIFGAPRALNYGTGIRGLVERSDKWETAGEIADQYLLNMGGIYRNAQVWGVPIPGLLEANLEGTDVVLQSRSSNVWGPVKLDHLYEFGSISAVVREKTGNEPAFLLSDARRPKEVRAQTLDEAIRDELQTTFWNRRWLEGVLREEGGGGAATLAKATQNLFGWSAVGAKGLVDDATWRRTVETFVDDRLNLGTREYFEKTNPAALAETTAVALDAARKAFWSPTPEELTKLATTHAETVKKFGASCSYNVCGNAKLRDFIAANLSDSAAQEYRDALDQAIRDPGDAAQVEGIALVETKKEEESKETSTEISAPQNVEPRSSRRIIKAFATIAVAVFLLGFAFGTPKRRRFTSTPCR